jgi:hypothetical protein
MTFTRRVRTRGRFDQKEISTFGNDFFNSSTPPCVRPLVVLSVNF